MVVACIPSCATPLYVPYFKRKKTKSIPPLDLQNSPETSHSGLVFWKIVQNAICIFKQNFLNWLFESFKKFLNQVCLVLAVLIFQGIDVFGNLACSFFALYFDNTQPTVTKRPFFWHQMALSFTPLFSESSSMYVFGKYLLRLNVPDNKSSVCSDKGYGIVDVISSSWSLDYSNWKNWEEGGSKMGFSTISRRLFYCFGGLE